MAPLGPDCVLDRVEHQLHAHRGLGPPAHDPAGVDIDHQRHIYPPGPRRNIHKAATPTCLAPPGGTRFLRSIGPQIKERGTLPLTAAGTLEAEIGRSTGQQPPRCPPGDDIAATPSPASWTAKFSRLGADDLDFEKHGEATTTNLPQTSNRKGESRTITEQSEDLTVHLPIGPIG